MARPTKLTKPVLAAFRAVLDDDLNVLMCTDWDLCFQLNQSLKREQRISYRTFQRYKREAMIGGYMNDDDDNADREEFDPIYDDLFELFAKALIRQKKALGQKILTDEKGWRRYQWMLERKFCEWNIRWSTKDAEIEKADYFTREMEKEQEEWEKYMERRRDDFKRELDRERNAHKCQPENEGFDWDNMDGQIQGNRIRPMEVPKDKDVNVSAAAEEENETQQATQPVPPPPPAETSPGAEPEKPIPYWKRPDYEPDPNRFRHLR